jgi:hypothetical protein
MEFRTASRIDSEPAPRWELRGDHGAVLSIPARRPGDPVRIALLGTRTRLLRDRKLRHCARQLRDLGGPLVLADVRRTGTGANGSWGPLEFRSRLPALLGDVPYAYVHLPELAPDEAHVRRHPPTADAGGNGTTAVSSRAGTDWPARRRAWAEHADAGARSLGRALLEWASARDGWLVLLGSGEHLPAFDHRDGEEQDRHWCHRYGLGSRLARAVCDADPGACPVRACLTLGALPEWSRWNRADDGWATCAPDGGRAASRGTVRLAPRSSP